MYFFYMKCFVNKFGFKFELVLNLVFINICYILCYGGRRLICRMDLNLYL